MIVGTTVYKMDGGAFYSPEFPRGGLGAVIPIDTSHAIGSPTATFQLEDRNEDDTSFGTVSGATAEVTSPGVSNLEATAIKELLRLKLTFDAGDAATDGIHFLIQAPTWRPYA